MGINKLTINIMEQMPQSHHREGVQEQLDKAYDEGHQDNKSFDEAEAKIADEESGHMDEKEMHGTLSLEETVKLLKNKDYLDTSFEGKETHPLVMRALTKKEALAEYKKAGGGAFVWSELEENMPYVIPSPENLDVMVINFGEDVGSEWVLAEMNRLNVRPITYEELIQYSIANPEHQKQQHHLVALGTKYFFNGALRALELGDTSGKRDLTPISLEGNLHEGCRFLVVRK